MRPAVSEKRQRDRPAVAHPKRSPADTEVVEPERLKQNLGVFDFELTDAELAAISALDRGGVGAADSDRPVTDQYRRIFLHRTVR